MRKVKTSRNLKTRIATSREAMDRKIPAPTSSNIHHGHLVLGMRNVNHIEYELWEQDVGEYLRVVDKGRLDRANRYYNAMNNVQKLLMEVNRRSAELQIANEEMQATNEEMQATTEELQSTNEELQSTTEEMERANAYRQTLMDSMTDILLTTDQSGVITDVNTATELISGYQKDELIGQPLHQFFAEQDRAQAGIAQLQVEGGLSNYDLTVVTKAGREVPVSFNATVLRDPDNRITGLLGTARDVTKQKQAEQELQKLVDELRESQSKVIQAGKMTAMGTMTAGVAHELNNPMMGILNFIQYSLKHTSEDDRRYTVLQDAERETKRCVEIVQNLLTFSRMDTEGEEDYQKESCAAILDRVLKLLSYRIEREKVALTQHTAQGTPDIWMRVNNIQQVFFNLLSNALDALKTSEKKEIHVDMHREGEFVEVSFADSGCGIPPEIRQKIFDPFFTTKPVGQATGLGLSICHSLIKTHNGEILCESEPGAGTKFKVLLPIKKAKAEKKQNE